MADSACSSGATQSSSEIRIRLGEHVASAEGLTFFGLGLHSPSELSSWSESDVQPPRFLRPMNG
jgi:hypothetical protein